MDRKLKVFFIIVFLLVSFLNVLMPVKGIAQEKLVAMWAPEYAISIDGLEVTAKFQSLNVGPYTGMGMVLCGGKINTLRVNGKAINTTGEFDANCSIKIKNVGAVKLTPDKVIILTESQKEKLLKLLQ